MTELFRRHRAKRAQGKKGFTLIELIIVIAILAILGTVVGVVMGNQVSNAKKAAANETAATFYADIAQAATWYSTSKTTYPYFKASGEAGSDLTYDSTNLDKYLKDNYNNPTPGTIYVDMNATTVNAVIFVDNDNNWGMKGKNAKVTLTEDWTTTKGKVEATDSGFDFKITISAEGAFTCAAVK